MWKVRLKFLSMDDDNNNDADLCSGKLKMSITSVSFLSTKYHMTSWNYRITGIFCGCLIFAEFCGSIEIAEIKNRKIFQSRYNCVQSDCSVAYIQMPIRYCCWNICIVRNTQFYKVHLNMWLSFKWHTVFEIKSVLLSAVKIFHGKYSDEFLTHLVL